MAERDGGEKLVLTISDELQAVLADRGVTELRAAAEQWVEANGFGDAGPLGDPVE